MFKKVLVANRGEIAVSIIRALHELKIKAVAVYSTADRQSLHVQLADEAICIGKPQPKFSYLNSKNILSAAILTGAEAIHPGFGFLSENPAFAQMCADCNIVFIGPSAETIRLMGDKANARETMHQAKVPIIPGSDGFLADEIQAKEVADKVGYPVLLKAAAGGGGKGIRLVERAADVQTLFNTCQQEAQVSFGDGRIYLEKVITDAKHVEVQIFRDHVGNTVYFPERDCSPQRHHQKVIEETPCPLIDSVLRKKIGKSAIRAAKAVNYLNTGTIEFLMDKQQQFYFMEMNTRIQVEHPITEMVTGIQLIQEQIRVAAGEKLSFSQNDIHLHGHAIECRINAENPRNGFISDTGTITYLHWPVGGLGIRIDTGIYLGATISPFYDAMLAKIIVHAPNREQAINRLQIALDELLIEGVSVNREFIQAIIRSPLFISGKLTTNDLEDKILPIWQAAH